MGSIFDHGVSPESVGEVTLTTHDWGHSDEWSAVNDSTFSIQPGPGEVWVLNECLIRFSAGLDFGPDNSLIIEGNISGLPGSIPITAYTNVRDFAKRADDLKVIDFMADGGGIKHPIVEARLVFSEPVMLWSTAGMTEQGPKKDVLGHVKLGSLVARLNNHSPFTMESDNSVPDLAICRYFISIYQDPDVG